jgi:hypothetical protein
MKTRLLTGAFVILTAALAGLVRSEAAEPSRPKRADSFLGIHFDFHAGPDCKEIGANTTAAMVERIVDLVRPDYLQIDCKGHRGLSSYPTKVGNPAPGFVGDPLRVWRDVTAARGVALYMHYSGVWDSEAIMQHPDWGAVNADGKVNGKATSFFGPYADQLLVPQLRELAGEYRVDGAWIDGECWASVPDYSPAAVAAFKEATGIANVPAKPGDPHWFEFLEFHREAFRKYLRHYIAEVKKTHPDFQLCSNWAYTDHMAEAVNAPVDFLSGDYSPQDSVNSARLSGRYLARQGKPWDLMAWSFSTQPDRSQKSAVQLQREAAVVLAQGGGFQAYFKQKRDGSIFDEQMPVMAEVAKFCRARQNVCHRSQAVPQVGLLLSTADHYRRINGLFPRDLGRVHGALQALLEGQQSVEVLGEHQLAGRLAQYPLIVVPECEYLDPEFRDSLSAYVNDGGNLLLIGPSAAGLFQRELGIEQKGEVKPEAPLKLVYGDAQIDLKGRWQEIATGDARVLGRFHAGAKPEVVYPAASIVTMGRGKIAATHFTLGQAYLRGRPEPLRRFVNDLVRELFPQPLVEVKDSSDLEVCVARNHGKLLVNLVNTAGPHQTQSILSEIPPVGPVDVSIRLTSKPAAVSLEPGGRPLAFDYRDGQVRLTVPKVDVHEIVVVTESAP